MKNKNLYGLGILLTILIGAYLNYLYCCEKEVVEIEEVVEVPEIEFTKNALTITDANGALDVREMDNFNFNLSNSPFLTPLSDQISSAVALVSNYFEEHPEKGLNITGLYKSDELNNSAFPNLGLARANAVKNYFVANGTPSRHINTFGQLDDAQVPDTESVLYGPVNFEVTALSENEALLEEMLAIAEEIKGKPLMLYFETGAATLTLTPEQRIKVAKISRYLDKVDESNCVIVGHTDNTGTPEGNLVLGQERADFAKDYLIRNHIRTTKVSSLSKGQTEPIETNDTDEGRAKNRRIVVTIN